MAAERGSAFLLKIGDGASPPEFVTVAGLKTTQLSINGDAVAITNKGSGGWRELLSGAGVRSVSVAASGCRGGSWSLGWNMPAISTVSAITRWRSRARARSRRCDQRQRL
jgi:hypothetical protein